MHRSNLLFDVFILSTLSLSLEAISVLRSYFAFLKNIVSMLFAKFVVWQELSRLLKLNIICGSEVISVLFYSDFKSHLSPFCAVEQGLLFRKRTQNFIKIW